MTETTLTPSERASKHETYAEAAAARNLPLTSYWHHANGRQTRAAAAADRQCLIPSEEKALVGYVSRVAARGYFIPVKLLRYLARDIVRRRCSPFQSLPDDDDIPLPGKNWPQYFYKRNPELRPKVLKPLELERHNVYDKVQEWFTVIGRELRDPLILPENVYNMDETGILLSFLRSRKVLVPRSNTSRSRGVPSKRQLVTAIEFNSANGQSFNPLIIWPTATLRSDWTIHPTPGWHFACSPSGYNNSTTALEWFRRVFDPQTKARANGRPRILINDGFAAHESLEAVKFCHKNNIILCRLPSHTSHITQPCDASVFGPLKTAYRDLVERLYLGGATTIGKQHFTLLYSRARERAFTPHNIKSGWAKAGLYPFNPDRVLRGIQKPFSSETSSCETADSVCDETLRTPVTSDHFVSLHREIESSIRALDDRSQVCIRKLLNAGERALTARDLLLSENQALFEQNNESSTRKSTKSIQVGKGKAMGYKEILEAQERIDRAAEVAEKGRRGRKRKAQMQAASPKRSRIEEIAEARCEITAQRLESFCSVV